MHYYDDNDTKDMDDEIWLLGMGEVRGGVGGAGCTRPWESGSEWQKSDKLWLDPSVTVSECATSPKWITIDLGSVCNHFIIPSNVQPDTADPLIFLMISPILNSLKLASLDDSGLPINMEVFGRLKSAKIISKLSDRNKNNSSRTWSIIPRKLLVHVISAASGTRISSFAYVFNWTSRLKMNSRSWWSVISSKSLVGKRGIELRRCCPFKFCLAL